MGLLQDLHFGLRRLWSAKNFTLIAALTLALGIGANLATFAIFNRVLWRPPPHVEDPDQLVRLEFEIVRFNGQRGSLRKVSYPLYEYLQNLLGDKVDLAAEAEFDVGFGQGASSEEVKAVLVSHHYFPLLRVDPLLGRYFSAEEDAPGPAMPVAVLSHGFWQRRFGGDPAVIGNRCWIANRAYTIIGVLPPGFTGPAFRSVDVWLPISTAAEDAFPFRTPHLLFQTSTSWVRILARLPTETSPTSFEQLLSGRSRGNFSAFSDQTVLGFKVAPIEPSNMNGLAVNHLSMWGVVVSVLGLLVGCANVANLILLRNLYRQQEIATRLQAGATTWQLGRQLLIECLLLTLLGGILSLGFLIGASSLLTNLVLGQSLHFSELIDARVLGFLGLTILLTTLVTGMLPTWRATRVDIVSGLKAGVSQAAFSSSRLRAALVVGQVALCAVLLVGAGLFWRSFQQAAGRDLGFDPYRVFFAKLPGLKRAGYDERQIGALLARVAEKAQSSPATEYVCQATSLPFQYGMVTFCERPGGKKKPAGSTYLQAVTPGYFATMGLKLIQGRVFNATDHESSFLVTVVNQKMARLFWPEENPLGQCLNIGRSDACTQVVGVVNDAVLFKNFRGPELQYYIPLDQSSRYQITMPSTSLLVRLRGDAREGAKLMEGLKSVSGLPYIRVGSINDVLEPVFRRWKQAAILLSVLGGLAAGIAAVGWYGQLTFWLANHRHEIGVRAALGAGPRQVIGLVLKRSLGLGSIGVAAGLLASSALASLMQHLFYGVKPSDPATLGAVALFLLFIIFATSLIPCRRALTVLPARALRYE